MSPPPHERRSSADNARDSGKKPRALRNRVAAFIVLLVVWTLLWGTFSPMNILAGIAVALIILIVLPLPPIVFEGRFRFKGIVILASKFVYDLFVASVQISWLAFRVGHNPGTAIAAVKLRVHTDLNITLVAELLSLIPGSLILEAEPQSGTLYVHVIGVETMDEVVAYTKSVLSLEARIVRAIGSDEEIQIVEEAEERDRADESPLGREQT